MTWASRAATAVLILGIAVTLTGAVVTFMEPERALAQEAAPPPDDGGEATPVPASTATTMDIASLQKVAIGTRLRALFFGTTFLLGIALLLSSNRKKIQLRTVATGLGLQMFFVIVLLWTWPGMFFFTKAKDLVHRLLSFTNVGTDFLFGPLFRLNADANASLDALKDSTIAPGGPYSMIDQSTGEPTAFLIVFAVQVLPTIIFFSSLMAVLYHLGIMQLLVRGVAWVMLRVMRTSGSESLSCSANIFVGQTEAPLMIRPYLNSATQSELMAVMTGGFATVAGGVMAAYVSFGADAGHLMAASVMSAPAALVVAKIMMPETEESPTKGDVTVHVEKTTANVIDAAATGAGDGLKLAANVGAMLLAFIALVAMFNFFLGEICDGIYWVLGAEGWPRVNLAMIFGWVFSPLAFAMGASWNDATALGNLLGTKVAVNEFLAFINLAGVRGEIHPHTFIIATYALCGFANFSSIAIQIGGISAIAPERRQDLARLGMKAMIAGAIASWLTATMAGVFATPTANDFDLHYDARITARVGADRWSEVVETAERGLANATIEKKAAEEALTSWRAKNDGEAPEYLTKAVARWTAQVASYGGRVATFDETVAARFATLAAQAAKLEADGEAEEARAVWKTIQGFGIETYVQQADAAIAKLGG